MHISNHCSKTRNSRRFHILLRTLIFRYYLTILVVANRHFTFARRNSKINDIQSFQSVRRALSHLAHTICLFTKPKQFKGLYDWQPWVSCMQSTDFSDASNLPTADNVIRHICSQPLRYGRIPVHYFRRRKINRSFLIVPRFRTNSVSLRQIRIPTIFVVRRTRESRVSLTYISKREQSVAIREKHEFLAKTVTSFYSRFRFTIAGEKKKN